MKYELGKNTTRNLESILQSKKPESIILVRAVKDFINYTPIDFCIIDNGGYRTAELQNELFLAGNSKCDGIKNLSEHQKGLAVDLVPWVNNRPTWETKHAFYLAGAFMSYCKRNGLHITSGADWNADGNIKEGFLDPCHMQIKEI